MSESNGQPHARFFGRFRRLMLFIAPDDIPYYRAFIPYENAVMSGKGDTTVIAFFPKQKLYTLVNQVTNLSNRVQRLPFGIG